MGELARRLAGCLLGTPHAGPECEKHVVRPFEGHEYLARNRLTPRSVNNFDLVSVRKVSHLHDVVEIFHLVGHRKDAV